MEDYNEYEHLSLLEWKPNHENGFCASVLKNEQLFIAILKPRGKRWRLQLIKHSNQMTVLELMVIGADEEEVKSRAEYYIYDGI
jgi:hypothetical protein